MRKPSLRKERDVFKAGLRLDFLFKVGMGVREGYPMPAGGTVCCKLPTLSV